MSETKDHGDAMSSAPQLQPKVVTTTRAVVQHTYGPPSVLRLEDVPIPAPTSEQVLVRVEAASVNAQDWHIMRGEPRIARLLAPAYFRLGRPRIAVRGTDLVGTVVAVGADVREWAPGDRVFGQGVATFAHHAVAAADELAALPVGLAIEHAAALPLAGSTALQCLEEPDPAPGSSLLINGASGGVGTFAIQIARSMGLHVTAVVSARNAGLAGRLGAEQVVDYAETDFAASGEKYDVVLDLVGNRTLDDLRRSVRPGGALVLSGGGVPGSGKVLGPFRLLVQAQLAARRSDIGILVPKAVPTTDRLHRLAELVESGHVTPVIDRTYALDRTADAVAYVEDVHPQGKVVIRMD
jgi:NADPH:quinone reductase-like Zn-dependent oxidoreductase